MAISGTLKVDPKRLTSAASSFKSQGQKIRNITQQMLSTVNSLNGSWEGDAQQAYSQRFKALDGDMAQIQLKITEHVDDLNEMAANYERAQSTNVSNISSLNTDYISG